MNKQHKLTTWAALSEATDQGAKVLIEALVYPEGTKNNPNPDLVFVAHPSMPANERIPCNSPQELVETVQEVARITMTLNRAQAMRDYA